jgi:7-cyano-7-deazaguanine synthase
MAVLCSGGLDSVVLLAHKAARGPVQPIYVSVGLAWEGAERDALERLLERPPLAHAARPLVSLDLNMLDVYPAAHWAVAGQPPAYDTPDEDVYIPGRNVTLICKAAVYCARQRIERLAMAPLAGNPFPDATPEFFSKLGAALSLGLGAPIELAAPFADLHKSDVIRLGLELGVPLELTLSCMNPDGGRHCGACSKCRERQHAFADAGVEDRTPYVRRAGL